jgi:hypothetical protein
VKTPELMLPHADELQASIDPLRHDPTFGARLSRKEYDQRIAARDAEWLGGPAKSPEADLGAKRAGAY